MSSTLNLDRVVGLLKHSNWQPNSMSSRESQRKPHVFTAAFAACPIIPQRIYFLISNHVLELIQQQYNLAKRQESGFWEIFKPLLYAYDCTHNVVDLVNCRPSELQPPTNFRSRLQPTSLPHNSLNLRSFSLFKNEIFFRRDRRCRGAMEKQRIRVVGWVLS